MFGKMINDEWQKIRKIFPLTEKLLYFNSAANAPLPIPVLNALTKFSKERSLYGANYDIWWKQSDNLREKISNLVNCRASQVGFTSGTTHSLNIIAQGINFKPGENIIISSFEFPANVYPWLNLEKKGIEIRFIPESREYINTDMLEKITDGKTRLISLSHVAFCNGFKADIEIIGEFCKKRNIFFVVDVMQSAGAIEVDMNKCKADALCFGSFKWLLGPDGLGFICLSKNLIKKIEPVFLGWTAMENRDDFFSKKIKLAKDIRKIELGNLNFSAVYGMTAALDLINSIGLKNITNRIFNLRDYFIKKFKNIQDKENFLILPSSASLLSQIVCFQSKNNKVLYEELKKKKIILGKQRFLRTSFSIFNDFSEIDVLLEEIKKFKASKV